MARNTCAVAWVATLLLTACDARPVAETPWILDPCGEPVSVALQKQIVPLLIGGGMNEKLDPKVMPADQLVNVTDAYRDKGGALRGRFGWQRMTRVTDTGSNLTNCRALFPLQGGKLGMIGSTSVARDALFVYSPTENKWMHNTRGYQPLPMAVTSLTALESRNLSSATLSDVVNPDYAVSGNIELTSMADRGGTGSVGYILKDAVNGSVIRGLTSTGLTGFTHRAAGTAAFLVVFVIDRTAFPYTLKAVCINSSTLAATTFAVTAGVVSGVLAFDVKSLPNGNILVAYNPNAGGVTVLEFNPSTGAVVTGPTNLPLAGVFRVCAWLEDPFFTGFYYLSVCDSAGGVNVKKITTALALSASTVVDVGATAAQSITGYLSAAAPTFVVVWDDGTALQTGAGNLVRGLHLTSKAFAVAGKYYVIGHYSFVPGTNPAVQPTAFVIATSSTLQDAAGSRVAGIIMPSVAGGLPTGSGLALITSVVVSGSKAVGALARVTKLTKDFITTTRQVVRASIDFQAKVARPRELSGTVFMPGGMVTQFDGTSVDGATFLLYPEVASAVTAAAGAMTASGVYQYVGVYRGIDSAGRVRRSAPSLPFTVTLGAGDHSATVNVTTLKAGVMASITDPAVEFYRAGPAASGGIIYNKVGEVQSDTTVDTVSLNDTLGDLAAASGELLYDPLANSAVLNNFPSPSTQILEVLDNRVFVVSAENPTEIWPSKEYKPGAGLAFNPALVTRITGSPIVALAAMDGRLVAFQEGQTWVIPIGAGPNDNGQGSFGDPQIVSLNVGCVDPLSVVNTPDGIMFQAQQGIYLLTRGFDVQYVGAAVEDGLAAVKADATTTPTPLAGAALGAGTNQVRFIGSDLSNESDPVRALAYDYAFKQWFEWNLPTQDEAIVSVATAGSTSYYADDVGLVWQETTNRFDETNDVIPWSFRLPALALGQLGGWALTYEMQVIGDFKGAHTLAVQMEPSYSPSLNMSGSKVIAAAAASYQYAFRPKRQKSTSMQPYVLVTPSGANEGATISALSLVIGAKGGRFPLAANRRLG